MDFGVQPSRVAAAGLCAVVAAFTTVSANAADFYKDKSVTITVGGNPGGVYDIVARAIARHMGKHIPGSPRFVVQNMPGAGSNKAAEWTYNSAPKDGLSFTAVYPGAIVGTLLDNRRKYRFDPLKFGHIGSADSGARICITFHTSKHKTFADFKANTVVMGASAGGGSTFDYAWMLNNLAGTKFRVVAGYKGTPDLKIAIERGEIDGMCGYSLAALRSEKLEWFTGKKINIPVYFGHETDKELAAMKVPEVGTFVSGDAAKAVELIVAQQGFARPYIAPPGVPAERIAILQDAFDKTMQDAGFKKEFEKSGSPLEPLSGKKMKELVEKMYAAPKSIVELAQKAQRPPQ